MTINKKTLDSMIRVNHAGEFGARVIYDGQIAALKLKKDHATMKLVEEMKAQEDIHFEYFDKKIVTDKVRPTVMQPVWKIGGFAMGFLTALLDKRAAMTCTTAVEEVIDEHYQSQLDLFENETVDCDFKKDAKEGFVSNDFCGDNEKNSGDSFKLKELKEKIEKFRADELEHRDIGYQHHAKDLPYFTPLSLLVKGATKFAIAVSKRV